jgi:hypothetical protein
MASGDPFADAAEALQGVREGEATIDEAQQKALLNVAEGRIRWRLAWLIAWAYVVIVVGLVAMLAMWSFVAGDNQLANMVEVVKIAVVPIVTLVIGYYFGSTSRG